MQPAGSIGDVDLSPGADRNKVSFPEFTQTFSRFSRHGQNLAAQIHFQELARESVHHKYVLVADLKRAGQSGILHLFKERAVLVENLNSLILPVRDPEPSLSIHCDAMRHVKFTGRAPLAAPGLQESSVLVEFQHARIALARAVPLYQKNIAIAAKGQIIWLVQQP